MAAKKIIVVLAVLIGIIMGMVGYGIYMNVAGSAHVDKLAAAQYSRVTGAKAAYRNIVPVLDISTLYLQSSWMLDVHVKLDGTIGRVLVNPGDQVHSGQLIGEIVNEEMPAQVLQAEGKISEARANLVKYNNTLSRYQALVNTGGISKQKLDEAIADQAAGAAIVATAEASRDQLVSRLAGLKIYAPRDGDILKVYSREGAFIRTGESFVMLGDFSTLQARETMSNEILEKLLPLDSRLKLALPEGQPASKAYAANYRQDSVSGDRNFDIRIEQVNPPLNVPARNRSVVWRVDNPGGSLEPGTYYRAKIYGTTPRRVLAIPRKAVSGKMDLKVYTVTADNRMAEARVKIGVHDDEYVEILSGLTEGDIVVLSGREGLSAGSKVQALLENPTKKSEQE